MTKKLSKQFQKDLLKAKTLNQFIREDAINTFIKKQALVVESFKCGKHGKARPEPECSKCIVERDKKGEKLIDQVILDATGKIQKEIERHLKSPKVGSVFWAGKAKGLMSAQRIVRELYEIKQLK